jgi:23S rRNA pseudouridine1911/1915/1917 synthase
MTTSRKYLKPVRQPKTPLSFCWQVRASEKAHLLADFLMDKLKLPLDQVMDLIDFGSVQIDGRQFRDPQGSLAADQQITVHLPWLGVHRSYEISPQRILYRDSYLLAYNKEAGIPSQQTPADGYNNLFAAVVRFLAATSAKPYVALHHRLDRETSGVMIFALDRAVNARLGSAFQQRHVSKDYLAWIKGSPADDCWVVSDDIGRRAGRYVTCPRGTGKSAETVFRVYRRESDRTLVWAQPLTGRTHQIRLHLQWCGHPIIGDRLYGGPPASRLCLHAFRLSLIHPVTKSHLMVVAPVPCGWPDVTMREDPGSNG